MSEENKLQDTVDAAEPMPFKRIRLCRNFRAGAVLPSCGARGANELAEALQESIAANGDFIELQLVHCLGRCHMGPTLKLIPAGPFLQEVQAEDVPRLVEMLIAGDTEGLKAAFPGTEPPP